MAAMSPANTLIGDVDERKFILRNQQMYFMFVGTNKNMILRYI
jgi:hypothetical protein